MSFFANPNSFSPGIITGNPLDCLCERVCIETNKVYDSCISLIEEPEYEAVIIDPDPPNPVEPLTFISCQSFEEEATVSNLVIERFEQTPNFARVTADINIPVSVVYEDANEVEGTALTNVVVTQDVILYVPQPSIVPFEVKAVASAVCIGGEYLRNNLFTLNLCITVILKVVAKVDLLIPSYGFCPIPPCQEFVEESCSELFRLPLFPQPEVA